MSNFQRKIDLFNDFFVEQCSIHSNGSTLALSYTKSDQMLDFIDTDDHKILRAIKNLNPKATITRCDLSSRFFCIDAALLCEFESDEI